MKKKIASILKEHLAEIRKEQATATDTTKQTEEDAESLASTCEEIEKNSSFVQTLLTENKALRKKLAVLADTLKSWICRSPDLGESSQRITCQFNYLHRIGILFIQKQLVLRSKSGSPGVRRRSQMFLSLRTFSWLRSVLLPVETSQLVYFHFLEQNAFHWFIV
jgi:hypothetical protein